MAPMRPEKKQKVQARRFELGLSAYAECITLTMSGTSHSVAVTASPTQLQLLLLSFATARLHAVGSSARRCGQSDRSALASP